MARKVLVEDLKKLFHELNESHGPVSLMMLLAPDPISESDWNLIVSAKGFDSMGWGDSIRQLASIVADRFQKESWRKILRFTVLKTDDPFVEAMTERFNAEASLLDLNNIFVEGVEIPKAIVLQSRAA